MSLQGPIYRVDITNQSFVINLNTVEFIHYILTREKLLIYINGRTEPVWFEGVDEKVYLDLFTKWKNFVTQERDLAFNHMSGGE